MGVLNVTPDSFSDGGRFTDPEAAIEHAMGMVEAGADIVDVGGESARPGAAAVTEADEASRTLPVVGALAGSGVIVSIDTSKPSVAAAAIEAGASIVNDVTGLRDADMLAVLASSDVGVVIMHMLGTPRTMQQNPHYEDVVVEVRDHLLARADLAVAAGIGVERIVIDPGIGFGKTLEHNLALLANIDLLVETGYPVLVGASRKSFIGTLSGVSKPGERDGPTAAAHALAIAGGARVIRVHDVTVGRGSARVADAIVAARRGDDEQ